jgi:hypothetical protein
MMYNGYAVDIRVVLVSQCRKKIEKEFQQRITSKATAAASSWQIRRWEQCFDNGLGVAASGGGGGCGGAMLV